MTDHIETCPDYHHCLNGSKCVENPYKEGGYYCDCDEVVFDVHYEGLFCEHKAEVYCFSENELNKHWFCTNGGTCTTEKSAPSEMNWGCDCPDEYEGSYCQFVKGSQPEGYPYTENIKTKQKSGSLIGAFVGSLVTMIVIASVVFAIFYRRKNQREERKFAVHTNKKLEIDPDGSLLKDSIATSMEGAGSNANLQYKSKDRPNTRESETGISFEDEEHFEENSMVSLS